MAPSAGDGPLAVWFHTKSEWNPSITALGIIYSTVKVTNLFVKRVLAMYRQYNTVGVIQGVTVGPLARVLSNKTPTEVHLIAFRFNVLVSNQGWKT